MFFRTLGSDQSVAECTYPDKICSAIFSFQKARHFDAIDCPSQCGNAIYNDAARHFYGQMQVGAIYLHMWKASDESSGQMVSPHVFYF